MITFLHNAGSCDMYTRLISLRRLRPRPRPRRIPRLRSRRRQGWGNISPRFLRSFVLRLNYSVALDVRNLNGVRPGKRSYTRQGEARRAKLNSGLNHISFPIAPVAVFFPCPQQNSLRKLLWCSMPSRSRMSQQRQYRRRLRRTNYALLLQQQYECGVL